MMIPKRTITLYLVFIGIGAACLQGNTPAYHCPVPLTLTVKESRANTGIPQIPFIENIGQADPSVAFFSRCLDGTLFVTKRGELIYSMPVRDGSTCQKRAVIRETLSIGQTLVLRGEKRSDVSVNWFSGPDSSRWQTGIPVWNRVSLRSPDRRIHTELIFRGNTVEKIFHLGPGVDSGRIRVAVQGTSGLAIRPDGSLDVHTPSGEFTLSRPVAFQEEGEVRYPVAVRYSLRGREAYGFELGPHDPRLPVTIDPLLASTFFGSSVGDEYGLFETAMAQDRDGNVYIADRTASTGFPVLAGGYDSTLNGGYDLFVAKFDPSLTRLLAVTFLGGNGNEGEFSSIALNVTDSGNVFVAGITYSPDFPVTAGAYSTTYRGAGDAFVAKLDANLSTLLASTFLGGSNKDSANAVAIDAEGHVFVSGWTLSTNFPTTAGSCGGAFHGREEVFLSRFDPTLASLQASTLIGGTKDDYCEGMVISPAGSVYLAGWTNSTNFPTTAGALFTTYRGGYYDAFIVKISSDLSALQASTYVGGSDWDFAYGIALDTSQNVYITGHTASTNYPTTPNAYDRSFNSTLPADEGDDTFVTKLDKDLKTLLASTYLGGQNWEQGTSIAISPGGMVFVCGNTSSSNFPTIAGAYSTTYHGATVKYAGDLFLCVLSPDLGRLCASTYLGGSGNDGNGAILLDCKGNVLVSGATSSSDFPTTSDAYDSTFNGGTGPNVYSFFVTRLNSSLSVAMTGDLNGDGKVDLLDLIILLEYQTGNLAPGTSPFVSPLACADVNSDSLVNEEDALILSLEFIN